MLHKILVLLFSILLRHNISAEAAKSSQLLSLPTKFECQLINKNVIKKLDCIFDTKTGLYPLIHFNITMARELTELMSVVEVTFERNGRKNKLISTRIDYCASLTTLNSNFIIAFVFKEIGRLGNLPLGCPIKKDYEYYFKNMNVSTMYIPPYMPKMDWTLDFELIFEGKKIARLSATGKYIGINDRKRFKV